jgi:hypothetical protein
MQPAISVSSRLGGGFCRNFLRPPAVSSKTYRSQQPAGKSAREHRFDDMIRKLRSGQYRLYSRKKDPRTGRRRNLGTFATRAKAEKHERAVQYFKRSG